MHVGHTHTQIQCKRIKDSFTGKCKLHLLGMQHLDNKTFMNLLLYEACIDLILGTLLIWQKGDTYKIKCE